VFCAISNAGIKDSNRSQMMGIILDWDNEAKTILRGELTWPWTWDELFTAWDTAVSMINSVPYTVHILLLSENPSFPQGNILSQLNRISPTMPNNTGLAILVTTNRFIAMLNTVFFKLSIQFRDRGQVVPSLEAAYALIAKESVQDG
jgi:hypothetical protein